MRADPFLGFLPSPVDVAAVVVVAVDDRVKPCVWVEVSSILSTEAVAVLQGGSAGFFQDETMAGVLYMQVYSRLR